MGHRLDDHDDLGDYEETQGIRSPRTSRQSGTQSYTLKYTSVAYDVDEIPEDTFELAGEPDDRGDALVGPRHRVRRVRRDGRGGRAVRRGSGSPRRPDHRPDVLGRRVGGDGAARVQNEARGVGEDLARAPGTSARRARACRAR